MRRRPLLLITSALVAVAAIGLAVAVVLPPRPGITEANHDRIETGMTRQAVESVFGQPAKEVGLGEDGRSGASIWESDGFRASIFFEEEDSGEERVWVKFCEADDTFAKKLRRWLHLP